MPVSEYNHNFIRYFIAFLFVVLIVVVLLSIYNPQEKTSRTKDKYLTSQSQQVLKMLNRFFLEKGYLPWASRIGSKVGAPGLSWTQVVFPEIGFCRDLDCFVPGEVSLSVATLEGKIALNKNDKLYIGKGVNPKDPIYVCFQPESQELKKKTGSLNRLNLTQTTSAPSKLPTCSDRVTWREDDVCFFCVSN